MFHFTVTMHVETCNNFGHFMMEFSRKICQSELRYNFEWCEPNGEIALQVFSDNRVSFINRFVRNIWFKTFTNNRMIHGIKMLGDIFPGIRGHDSLNNVYEVFSPKMHNCPGCNRMTTLELCLDCELGKIMLD